MNFEKLTQYLDSLERNYQIPGLECRITKDHEEVYHHLAGHSDYERQVPTSEDDLYRMFSTTKVITVTAALQLVESGRLGLYDELCKYLPEFAVMRVAEGYSIGLQQGPRTLPTLQSKCHLAHNRIRIIDLFTMTAGFSYDTASEPLMELKKKSNNKANTREVVAAIAKMPLLYEPGTRWDYSLAHDVLAAVIEVVSGMTFGEYLKANIFEPLGITDLYLHLDEEQEKRLAAIYDRKKETGEVCPVDTKSATAFLITENYESGGGSLIGTVNAYSTILEALANDGVGANGTRILSEESVRLLETSYTSGAMVEDFKTFLKDGYGYGLGVRVLTDQSCSPSALGEFGWDGAAGAYALVDAKNHISIFYAQHVTGYLAVYTEIQPHIRDLAYEAMGIDERKKKENVD